MDSVAVLSMCNWIMGELVRVYHNVTTAEAQAVVDAMAEARIPVIWAKGNLKRILIPTLKLPDQILLLTASSVPSTTVQQLFDWIEYENKTHFMKTMRLLHRNRLIEFNEKTGDVQILPPGANVVRELIKGKKLSGLP
jgi:hypothetical protein